MKTQGINSNFSEAGVEALAVAVFKQEKATSPTLKELDKLTGGLLAPIIKDEDFKGEIGETALIRFSAKGKVKASRLLLVGVGDKADYNAASVSGVAGAATRFLRKRNVKSFALMPRCEDDAATVAQSAAQGYVTSQFELDKYRTQDKNSKSVDSMVLFVEGAEESALKSGLARGVAIGDSMNFARDLANEPPNILHPTEMAKRAQAMAKETGLKCEILDEAKMQKLGMGSLLSVSLGSEQPAKLI
ncbi:MAG TPA: M17 family peptidase N-terminal domain-containing protein, partial [Pyrinomonadaceae bacterium]|nr:M17 family peptidase N-terminal domain-containing protein [Pyrinomonadaceae bacterium]